MITLLLAVLIFSYASLIYIIPQIYTVQLALPKKQDYDVHSGLFIFVLFGTSHTPLIVDFSSFAQKINELSARILKVVIKFIYGPVSANKSSFVLHNIQQSTRRIKIFIQLTKTISN